MTFIPAGETVDVTITWLEMTGRPAGPRPQLPSTMPQVPTALLHAEAPPAWYFLSLYDAVGRDYDWVDRHSDDPADLTAWLHDTRVSLYTLIRNGWPHGFFHLDARAPSTVNLAYFGLVPEAIGLRLGTWLLGTAIHMAWDIPGTQRLTVNTCTLDHPRALSHYQRHGFSPVSQTTYPRKLTRDRDPARFP